MCHMLAIGSELLCIVMHNHEAWFFNKNVFFCVKVATCVSRTRQNYTKALTIFEKNNNNNDNKGYVMLNLFINFAYIRSYDQTKT